MATAPSQAAELTGHAGRITALTGDPDAGKLLWSGGADGSVLAWDAETLEPTGASQPGEAAVTALAVHRGRAFTAREDGTITDGERRLEVGFAASSLAVDGGVLWAVDPGGRVLTFELPGLVSRDTVEVIQPRLVSAGRAGIAVACDSGEVILFSTDGGVQWRGYATPKGAATAVAVVGNQVVTGADDGFVGIWTGPESFADVTTGAPVTSVAAGIREGQRIVASGHADGTLVVTSSEPAGSYRRSTGTEPVAPLVLVAVDGRLVPVTGGADGRLRRWDPQRPRSDKVEWLSDAPSETDQLRRRPLARALARRLGRLHAAEPGRSFLIHIDGAWGTGKSTILRYVGERMSPGWLVVDFNAWKRSRVGPPWWALLVALRGEVARSRRPLGRLWLRLREAAVQVRRGGGRSLVAFVVAAIVAAALYLLLKPADTKSLGDTARSIAAVVAAIGTLWAAGMVVARTMLWDSAKGARVYEQAESDPMAHVADHFAWLVARAGRPILFFVDDLDRCPSDYVVEMLEAIQTLMRDDREGGNGTYFVVAADGTWVRASYEQRYEDFAGSVGEPGRPLGYLFLEKLFQLTVRVPVVSALDQSNYLAHLLSVGQPDPDVAEEVAEARERLRSGASDAEVVEVLRDASPDARAVLRETAVERLSDERVQAATEHALQPFAEYLEPNPRAMKRFVNEFGLARVVLTLEDSLVPFDVLARWTILSTRWPMLADRLREHPEEIELVGEETPGLPRDVRALLRSPDVGDVARGLTRTEVEMCVTGRAST